MTCGAARYTSSLALGAALLASAAHGLAQAPAAPPPAPARPAQPAPAAAAPAPAAPLPPAPAPGPAAAVTPPPATPSPSGAPEIAPEPPPVLDAQPTVAPPPPEPPTLAAPPLAEPPPLPVPPPLPPSEDIPWYETIQFAAFADGYFGLDFNFPKAPGQARVNPIRAYDNHNGFSLSWVGLDIQKTAEPVGGTLSLRFGPTAQRLADACADGDTCDGSSSIALSFVKQAFASWKPGGAGSSVTLDFGKFDTPYGVEVAESQFNINYTRGVLYWLGQPAYHTGLRVGIDASRNFNLKLLAVNGWNRSIDNNSGKSFGLQGTLRLPKAAVPEEDMLTVALGYMVGPEHGDSAVIDCGPGTSFDPDTNPDTGCVADASSAGGRGVVDRGSSNSKGLRHFVDLALVAQPTDELKLLLNGSLGIDNVRDGADIGSFVSKTWYGIMGGARLAVAPQFGVGGRVEYYGDPDGYTTGEGITLGQDVRYVTGTLTLDYAPTEHMILFLDGRLDWASKQVFPKSAHDHDVGTDVSATLGAVVTTN